MYRKKTLVSKKNREKIQASTSCERVFQQKGIDYDEVFFLVVRNTSIRSILALVAIWDLHLDHMDVKIAFLHGDLDEHIYMKLEGFVKLGHEHLVCIHKRSFYGLKHAPR